MLLYRPILRRRDGRVVEGAPLLREYGPLNPIEGSNPSLSAKISAACKCLSHAVALSEGGQRDG